MNSDEIISARKIAIENMEFYIKESIYYRSYSEHMNIENKLIVWNIKEDLGKAQIK